jgi:ABC-2 type transport system ATP-binding protein
MSRDKGHLITTDDPNSGVAIRVEDVSKSFRLPHNKQSSLKGSLINLVSRGDRSYETQKVLKGVSFEIKKGEFFGIVGRNGSGKSTLLKMLAGIYTPTRGKIIINGSLTPFIELGVGFNPELTGRENVYLNGALLGFNEREVAKMYDDIVSFAELERFMDQRLKNYSSGMQVRLAFSIAIRAKSDILLIDEVLAVGDAAFQQKCFQYFDTLKKEKRTVIIVTHDMAAVARLCNRVLLIDNGDMLALGSAKDVADAYLELNYQASVGPVEKSDSKEKGSCHLEKVTINEDKLVKQSIKSGDTCKVSIFFQNPERRYLHFGFQIFGENGTYCFGINTAIAGVKPTKMSQGCVVGEIDMSLVPGNYTITAAIMNETGAKVLSYRPRMCSFRVSSGSLVEGVANLKNVWSIVSV